MQPFFWAKDAIVDAEKDGVVGRTVDEEIDTKHLKAVVAFGVKPPRVGLGGVQEDLGDAAHDFLHLGEDLVARLGGLPIREQISRKEAGTLRGFKAGGAHLRIGTKGLHWVGYIRGEDPPLAPELKDRALVDGAVAAWVREGALLAAEAHLAHQRGADQEEHPEMEILAVEGPRLRDALRTDGQLFRASKVLVDKVGIAGGHQIMQRLFRRDASLHVAQKIDKQRGGAGVRDCMALLEEQHPEGPRVIRPHLFKVVLLHQNAPQRAGMHESGYR